MFGDNYRQQGEYCEFCMMNMDEEDFNHIPECPLNFIQPENYYQILEHQFIDEETNSEDAAYIVGKQIFLAIDAVLAQQKKWAQKSLMSKFDEVLNRYTELTQFVVALRDADVLKDADAIISFLLDPAEYDDLFAVWIEFGQPQIDDDTWQDFISAVVSCGWKLNNS